MQEKLNAVGYNCGTADGKFGNDTDTAVRNFQRDKGLTVDGKAGKNTLLALDNAVGGGGSTGGAYPITFGTNQEVVYGRLRNAGLGKIAIAGIMGNIEAESGFSTAWGTSAGICQWTSSRKSNLEKFANSKSLSKTSIYVQADFILDECSSNGAYKDSLAVSCMSKLKDTTTVNTVKKAADYFTALYERCDNFSTWASVVSSDYSTGRFSSDGNAYNGRYYLDTPKRRGYAESYYDYLLANK